MAKIEFPVAETYVASWSKFEAVREVLQNARDASVVLGAEMEVKYLPRSCKLQITTVGAAMDCRDLLIGRSSKSGDSRAAGQHGEGLKLALLVFARLGCKVTIETGDEVWRPAIETSAQFGGERVLVVYTRKVTHRESVSFEIEGISQTDWDAIRPKFLFIEEKGEIVETYHGRLLQDPRYVGHIFCKGIFVAKMEGVTAGYDIPNLQLDRDRRLVDAWSAKYYTSLILNDAAEKCASRGDSAVSKKLYENMLNPNAVDGPGQSEYASDEIAALMATEFAEQFGDETYAVASEADAGQVRALGGRAVVVSKALAIVVQKKLGNLDARKASLVEAATSSIDDADLTADELGVLRRVRSVLSNVFGEKAVHGSVVMFPDSKLGLANVTAGTFSFARSELREFSVCLLVHIHELAHIWTRAGDGDARHINTIEESWAAVTKHIVSTWCAA